MAETEEEREREHKEDESLRIFDIELVKGEVVSLRRLCFLRDDEGREADDVPARDDQPR